MSDDKDQAQQAGLSASTIDAANQIPNYMPPWMKQIQPMQLPQGAPGQLQMLASDLAAGGYGTPKSNMAWMDQFYNPVNSFKQGDLTKKQPDAKTGTPGQRPTPYMVPTNTPMGGNSMTEWWKTSLSQDPTYRKVYGNSRRPKG